MIKGIKVSNFRSLGRDVSLRLNHLTALVGPNGSGKSNVTDVFRFIAEANRNGLDTAISARGGIGDLRRWGYGKPYTLSVRVETRSDDGEGVWELQISGENKGDYKIKREYGRFGPVVGWSEFETRDGKLIKAPAGLTPKPDQHSLTLPLLAGDERLAPLSKDLRHIPVYSIFPDALGKPQPPDPTWPMDEHGNNWCSVLRALLSDSEVPELVTALGALSGDIESCKVSLLGGHLVAKFRHGIIQQGSGKPRHKWFNAAQESDGTLRIAGILTALFQDPLPSLIGIEEPEMTVHPGVLPLVAEYLLEASTRGQILITTHSPDLLDLLSTDHIRVVERREGVTRVSKMQESQRRLVRERLFSLGELMRTEGLKAGEPDTLEDDED